MLKILRRCDQWGSDDRTEEFHGQMDARVSVEQDGHKAFPELEVLSPESSVSAANICWMQGTMPSAL